MKTKDVVNNLLLMTSSIEELEIDNILTCTIVDDKITCHLSTLKLANDQGIWERRDKSDTNWPWEKSYYHNNIKFFALYTQEEYEKEQVR